MGLADAGLCRSFRSHGISHNSAPEDRPPFGDGVVEGNHDRSYYRDGVSWLEFLCWQKLLILLNPYFSEGVPQLTAWDQDEMRGAYVDLKDGRLRSMACRGMARARRGC